MSVLQALVEQRDAAMAELEGLTPAEPEQGEDEAQLTEEQEARSTELLVTVDELDERIAGAARLEQRARTLTEARQILSGSFASPDTGVVDEPRVYGKDSPNSYYADLIWVQTRSPFDPKHIGAGQRLTQWSHQVEREYALDTPAGKAAGKQLREIYRESGNVAAQALAEHRDRGRVAVDQKQEMRSIATGSGTTVSGASGGAALVGPAIFIQDYAPYREAGRAFADQTYKRPLPDWGMQVYIPAVQGAAGIAQQTETNALQETDPTFGYLNGALITEAGQVTVSQQMLDRSGPNFDFDVVIFDQLNRDYAPNVDKYVLTQALTGATSQNWVGNNPGFVLVSASKAGGFYGQVSQAKASIMTAAGTFLKPSHLFLKPGRWENILAYADSNGRPLVVPTVNGNPFNTLGTGPGSPVVEGATGYSFNELPVFTDQNIPSLGTTSEDQAIVGCLNEVWFYEGTPVTRVVPQTNANTLLVLLQMYAYMTCIVRYPAGVVAISGLGMNAITYSAA